MKQLLALVQPGDWFTTIDLKDAYFHVEIAPKHRKYLRFAFQGIAYEYNRLPFGYSLSPRTFSKCVATALQPLRAHGMRVFFYIDDLIVMAGSREQAMFCTAQLITHLTRLSFAINWKKSTPIPHQRALYLGVVLDAGTLRATLSESRRASLLQGVRRLRQGARVTAFTVMQTLGLMAAAHMMVPLGLIHMRRLLRWFQPALGSQEAQATAGDHTPLSEGQPPVLGFPDHLQRGSPLGRVTSYITVFTDASGTGWGGTCQKRAIGGRWALTESRHSNLLELRAVVFVLRHFRPLIQGEHVMVRSDNSTTVAYINKQGGVRSATLLTTAEELWLWASEVVLSLSSLHIPGLENEGADLMPCQASGCFTRRC
ncbi:hypothetical protein CesoFtcFv8_007851 [Champsocephalus esox]|uniref:ribonuclease H n=1 Tax=Champsocephalus esox TaxID=159716 RepID=A0AAN8CFJ1_9TELE|nr:hypothetical protein CesoFtcFv8_007851 [Champsocephalus esox]